ncbi:MAG TPA: poly-beta-1,6 N-acetyl-D-glucosamine export porin PgaA, partial [Methylophilaceae bacterium]|nr:poly-beta-1,6 N-acetyl-D-glucosamine export porin PgaA [Methylophilaceae bacterium]
DQAVLVTLAFAASQLGASNQAEVLLQGYQLDVPETVEIKVNHAASHIRWGEFESEDPLKPYAETDQALSLLDKACQCDWTTIDVTKAINQRLVFDRMLALLNRHRAHETVMHYKQLQAKNINVPVYALDAAGGAYLQLREPDKALVIFDTILEKDPTLYKTQLNKFYALIELERFDEASKLINKIAAAEPKYINRKDNPIIRENEKKLRADITKALGLSYGDNLAGSDKMLTALHNVGPSNIEVKNTLADIWRQRGWLDLAEKSFKNNLAKDKYNTHTKYGLAKTYLDGRDWAMAEKEINELNSYISPDEPILKDLNEAWKFHQKRQFISNFSTSSSSGSAVASKTKNIDALLYSAPFRNNYRAFAYNGLSNDDFPEGTGNILRPALGLEYRSYQWLAAAQLGIATNDGHGASGAINAQYRANDFWLFDTNIEFNAQQMPTRGQRVGIKGDLVEIGATYRWSELMQASSSAGYMHMSDGNIRKSLRLTLDRRLITTPHYKANIGIYASASKNNTNNAVYFNPKSDTEIAATLTQNWLTWRRYDRSFTQRLDLSTGHYQQEDFGGKGTWSIRYSHIWRFDRQFSLEYGIARTSHPYDGLTEFNNSFFGSINLLF